MSLNSLSDWLTKKSNGPTRNGEHLRRMAFSGTNEVKCYMTRDTLCRFTAKEYVNILGSGQLPMPQKREKFKKAHRPKNVKIAMNVSPAGKIQSLTQNTSYGYYLLHCMDQKMSRHECVQCSEPSVLPVRGRLK